MFYVICIKGWIHSSFDFSIMPLSNALSSSSHYFKIQVATKTWTFLSIVQPKKRANTLSRYWYYDMSLLVLKRRLLETDSSGWIGEKCLLQGVQRSCEIEIFLDPAYEYIAVPVSFGWSKGEVTLNPSELDRSIRFATYSSNSLIIEPVTIATRLSVPIINQSSLLSCFHRDVLKMPWREQHTLGPQCVLSVSRGSCCAYFVVLNASNTDCLQLRLLLQTKSTKVYPVCGGMDDLYMIPPRSEKICVVLLCDGREAHVSSVLYSYYSDAMQKSQARSAAPQRTEPLPDPSVGSTVDITFSSDLLAGSVGLGSRYHNGKGELYFCIEQ